MEAPENKKRSYDSTFKATHTDSTSTKGERRKKENRRKINEKKEAD